MAPMTTRGKDKDDTICHDAHTMALRRANRTHEFNTIMNLRKVFGHFFGMPKILPSLTKLLPKPEELNRWSYDGFRCPHEWPDVYTIRPEFEHFHNRVSIWCQVRDSVTPALPSGCKKLISGQICNLKNWTPVTFKWLSCVSSFYFMHNIQIHFHLLNCLASFCV